MATPPVLAPVFLLVAVHATLELITGALVSDSIIHKLFQRTSELVEMYLAIAWLYVFLNARQYQGAGERIRQDRAERLRILPESDTVCAPTSATLGG